MAEAWTTLSNPTNPTEFQAAHYQVDLAAEQTSEILKISPETHCTVAVQLTTPTGSVKIEVSNQPIEVAEDVTDGVFVPGANGANEITESSFYGNLGAGVTAIRIDGSLLTAGTAKITVCSAKPR